MSQRFQLPDGQALKATLAMIYGEEPEVSEQLHEDVTSTHVATYVDADNNHAAYCFCDMSAAASLACALSLVPVPTAQDMIDQAALSEIAQENLYEVMNIFSSLFMNDDSDHLRLATVNPLLEANDISATDMRISAYQLSNIKYPTGCISFACA